MFLSLSLAIVIFLLWKLCVIGNRNHIDLEIIRTLEKIGTIISI